MFKYVRQLFTGGMNQDMPPVMLDLESTDTQVVEMVASVSDFVFERGVVQSRPAVQLINNASGITSTERIVAITKVPITATPTLAGRGLICLTVDGVPVYRLYYLSTALSTQYAATQITGPGLGTSWNDFDLSMTVVNGSVLITGNSQGIIRWVPTGTTYTIISTAKFAYVTHQFSRAIAAFQTTGSSTDPLTVAASVAGDETTWTGLNSYTNILSDVDDAITGIGVIRGVVVLARQYGFHLGIPTGIFPNIYNWQLHSGDGIGCTQSATFDTYKDMCFFCSDTGVHMFDTVQVVDIGEGILKEIGSLMRNRFPANLLQLRGSVASSHSQDLQPSYHLFLDGGSSGFTQSLPHWVYNINERKWSRHFYSGIEAVNPGTTYVSPQVINIDTGTIPGFSALRQPSLMVVPRTPGVVPSFYQWDPVINSGSSETVSPNQFTITSGTLSLSPAYLEAFLSRVLLHVYAPGTMNVYATIVSTLNGVTTTTSITSFRIGGPTAWIRVWVDIPRIPGQDFVMIWSFRNIGGASPYTGFKIKEMLYEFTVQGKTR